MTFTYELFIYETALEMFQHLLNVETFLVPSHHVPRDSVRSSGHDGVAVHQRRLYPHVRSEGGRGPG